MTIHVAFLTSGVCFIDQKTPIGENLSQACQKQASAVAALIVDYMIHPNILATDSHLVAYRTVAYKFAKRLSFLNPLGMKVKGTTGARGGADALRRPE